MRMMMGLPVLLAGAALCFGTDIDDEPSWEHEKLADAASLAASKGNIALMEELLKAGLEINKPVDVEMGHAVLHEAVSSKQPDMIRFLLKKGANPFLRGKWGDRPVDGLSNFKGDVEPLLKALERPLDEYDKKLIADVPAPVWLEVFGEPAKPLDPLKRPVKDNKEASLPLYISINGSDPVKELRPALDFRYPGWNPVSESEEVDQAGTYRDRKTGKPVAQLQITVMPAKSKEIESTSMSALIRHCKTSDLPTCQYKVRYTRGPLAGGGHGGYLVLVAGYWIPVAGYGFDE